jgi:hypothetical protein
MFYMRSEQTDSVKNIHTHAHARTHTHMHAWHTTPKNSFDESNAGILNMNEILIAWRVATKPHTKSMTLWC